MPRANSINPLFLIIRLEAPSANDFDFKIDDEPNQTGFVVAAQNIYMRGFIFAAKQVKSMKRSHIWHGILVEEPLVLLQVRELINGRWKVVNVNFANDN